MSTAFDIMFPEGSRSLALLTDYAKHPDDFNRFLESVPPDLRKLFSKAKVAQAPRRPAISDVTCMELTGFYKQKTNKKLAPFNFSMKMFTTDGVEFDLNEPVWSAISYVTTPNRFKSWQTRNKPDAGTVEDMQTLFDMGFNHVAPFTSTSGGRLRQQGYYFAANVTGKVVHEAIIVFDDYILQIPQESFIYREANGPFKNAEVFARYRYSKLKARPAWASTEEWIAR
jgi:hypothetical protein